MTSTDDERNGCEPPSCFLSSSSFAKGKATFTRHPWNHFYVANVHTSGRAGTENFGVCLKPREHAACFSRSNASAAAAAAAAASSAAPGTAFPRMHARKPADKWVCPFSETPWLVHCSGFPMRQPKLKLGILDGHDTEGDGTGVATCCQHLGILVPGLSSSLPCAKPRPLPPLLVLQALRHPHLDSLQEEGEREREQKLRNKRRRAAGRRMRQPQLDSDPGKIWASFFFNLLLLAKQGSHGKRNNVLARPPQPAPRPRFANRSGLASSPACDWYGL